MGGTVSSRFFTPAEDTAGILQQALHAGSPVMVPGALERRVGRSMTGPARVAAGSVTLPERAVVMRDRARLEREREGGGAPSQRTAGRRRSALARLWRLVMHPGDRPIV